MMLPAAILVLLGSAFGGWLLRRGWRQFGQSTGINVAGWIVILATIAVASFATGPLKGIALAICCAPIALLGIVAEGRATRDARGAGRQSLAPEPLQGPSRVGRGVIRFVLAGPLGMLAALAVAFCYASWAPGAIVTRILVAALLVPLLWALAMTWTLADQRLGRAFSVLLGTSIVGFGLAVLGGLA